MRGAPSAARRLVAAPRNQQPFRFDPHVFDRDFSHLDDVVLGSLSPHSLVFIIIL